MKRHVPCHIQDYDLVKAMAAAGACSKANPSCGDQDRSKRCSVLSAIGVCLFILACIGVVSYVVCTYACSDGTTASTGPSPPPWDSLPTESSMALNTTSEFFNDYPNVLLSNETFNSSQEETTTKDGEIPATDLLSILGITETSMLDQGREATSAFTTLEAFKSDDLTTIANVDEVPKTTERITVPECTGLLCTDGTCIRLSQVDDGVVDCSDGADEPGFGGVAFRIPS